MTDDQVTIIPNANPSLCKATLSGTGEQEGQWEVLYEPIVAWAVRAYKTKAAGTDCFSADAIGCDMGGREDDDTHAIFDRATQDWHIPQIEAGNGEPSLIAALAEKSNPAFDAA